MVVVLSLTQNGQDATRGPDEEAGPHGSRVQQHGLRGNEDARADDRPHDQADATEQTHLCQVGRQGHEFVFAARDVKSVWCYFKHISFLPWTAVAAEEKQQHCISINVQLGLSLTFPLQWTETIINPHLVFSSV